ncbi:MAG: hypothetical protein J6T37_05960 [Bacteroidales bacterium]|nr:hypothetical protein [Bacteroidales bacterium]MBQ3844853.1 hypothetical protein [Bacteroidales bacterium]
MKKSIIIPLMLIIGLALVSFASGVTLRLRPQKDKSYVINSTMNQKTVMKVQGQSITSTQKLDLRQTFVAKEIAEQSTTFETQIEAIKMTGSTMGMTFTYDSENPQNTSPMIAQQAKEYEGMIKKPVIMTFNELGLNTNPDDNDLNQLRNAIIELPEKEMSVGSQWTFVKTNSVGDYDYTVNMTCTVTGISKKSIDFSFTGDINSKDVTGNFKGNSSIDPRTGIIIATTTENTLSVTISEEGMEIPMTITGTNTISVKEL